MNIAELRSKQNNGPEFRLETQEDILKGCRVAFGHLTEDEKELLCLRINQLQRLIKDKDKYIKALRGY